MLAEAGAAAGAAAGARTTIGSGGCRDGVNNGWLGVAVSAPSGIAQSGLALSVDALCGLAEISGAKMAGRTTLGTELSVSGPFAASVAEGIPASVRVASQSATTKVRVTHMRLTAPQPATRAAS